MAGKVNNSIKARTARTICCGETGGILLLLVGGATNALVVMVTFPVPGAVTGDEGPVQPPETIVAAHVIVTAPVNPPTPVTVTGIVPEAPGVTEMAEALIVKSQAVPLRLTVCVVGDALSVTVRTAASVPLVPAAGVNVTLITQVAFAATVAPLVQVLPLAIAKSAAPVPEIAGAVPIVNVELPVFLTVMTCAALVVVTNCPVNVSVEGETVATAALATPVPVMFNT